MLECVCALRVPRRGAGFLHMLSSCLRRLALTIRMCREPAMGSGAATWLVITLSHRCPPVPGPVRAGSHLRAHVTEGELSLRGPPGGHTLAGGHARAARSPAGPRLALTGREPVSPRIISRAETSRDRGGGACGVRSLTPHRCVRHPSPGLLRPLPSGGL